MKTVANKDRWTPEMVQLLAELWDLGLSSSEIGRRFKISRNAVIGKICRMRDAGYPFTREKVTPAQRSKLATAARHGLVPKAPRAAKPKSYRRPTSPQMKLVRSVAPEVRESTRQKAFEPLAGSTPMIWTERPLHACKWPVGGEGAETLSCCEPAPLGNYCTAHAAVAFVPAKPRRADPQPSFKGRPATRFAA